MLPPLHLLHYHGLVCKAFPAKQAIIVVNSSPGYQAMAAAIPSFNRWLRTPENVAIYARTRIGDLMADVQQDPEWNSHDGIQQLRNKLEGTAAEEALEDAWDEFRRLHGGN